MTVVARLWIAAFTLSLAQGVEADVRVERVVKDQAAERAGLHEGDVLARWVRGNDSGRIDSPFDLGAVEIEQSPRGRVTLEGWRGEAPQSWTLGPDAWGLESRPDLPADVAAAYEEGLAQAKAGHWRDAGEAWTTAGALDSSAPPSARVWLAARTAASWAEGKQWTEADDAYRRAVRAAEAAPAGVASQILAAWGETYQQRSDWANAEKAYRESIEKAPAPTAATLLIARSLNAIGYVAWWRGDLAQAEDLYRRSLAIREQIAPESLEVAASENGLGGVAYRRGDLATAEEHYGRALAIQSVLAPDSLGVARSLNNLGLAAWQRGDLTRAEAFHRRALALHRKLAPEGVGVAASLTNLGIVAWERGDLAGAEQQFRDALALQQTLAAASPGVAGSLSNLGTLAWQRGDLEDAEKYLRQALDLQNKLAPEGLGAAVALESLGLCARDRGDLSTAAEDLRRALAIRERVAPDSLIVAESAKNLGDLARLRGELGAADTSYRRALTLRQTLAPDGLAVAESLNDRGDTARAQGDVGEAERDYEAALAIRERLAPGSRGHAESLAALASIRRDADRGDEAAALYERALAALESETARLGGAEEVRAAFRARHASYYADYMDLLRARGEPEKAFQVLERSRAQTFREMLAAARLDVGGVAPELEDRERSLRQTLSAKADRRLRLLAAPHTDNARAALEKEIDDRLADYRRVEGEIRIQRPAYAALMQPSPVRVSELQRHLLGDDTLLLEYALGDAHSTLWVVSATGLASYTLPSRAVIEEQARRVHALMTARNHGQPPQPALRQEGLAAKADADAAKAAALLSHTLLGPIAETLARQKLLIVPDGALHYVPFEALPIPTKGGAETALARAHEIAYLPSAAVGLALVEAPPRPAATRTVAVLADPIFGSDDARVRRSGSAPAAPPIAGDRLTRSASDLALADAPKLFLSRLPLSREEAENILKAAHGDGLRALGFEASRATAMSLALGRYRIVHFATHGLLDNRRPELSGLVLTMVDRKGRPQNGFLDLQDIYNLDLPAELVVLSACETGLGKEIDGEGLIGLTRGFMYAGARRVVASLWKVDDDATAELMKRFYAAMLGRGLTPSAALRQAKLELQRDPRWSAPYFWAPFVLEGS